MLKNLKELFIPILSLIFIVGLCFICGFIGFDSGIFFNFLIGALMVLSGQLLFITGAEHSIIKIGKHSGSALIKFKKTWIILLFGAIFGFVATLAEPDIQILANIVCVVNNIPKILFMVVIGLGVGIFTMIAYLRILNKFSFKYILMCLYALIFIFACFIPNQFLVLAFDSSGMTTGPITVPFLMALTIGLCSIRNNNKKEDCFGVVAISSAGSILALEILSLFFPVSSIVYTISNRNFFSLLAGTLLEVSISLLPILIIFIIMQIICFKFPRKYVLKIILSLLICGCGLTLFLTGVSYGFSPMGLYLGCNSPKFLLYLLSIIFGGVLVFTEPSVILLLNQIEDVTNGIIKSRIIILALAISVIISLLFAMLKLVFEINILWFLIPIFILIFILSFFTPPLFFAIAFDSGGVISGTMLVAFVLPFFIGASNTLHGYSVNAFGTIGIVTLLPILAIEILGLFYKKSNKKEAKDETLSASNIEKK